MRNDLPKYALLSGDGFVGLKVISLEHPYIIASVHDYHRDDERARERMDDMVQGRYPIAKVKGYTVFLTMHTSLEPCSNQELQKATLNEMAQYFLEDKIAHKPGVYARCEESGKTQKKFERVRENQIRLRERRKRTNESND